MCSHGCIHQQPLSFTNRSFFFTSLSWLFIRNANIIIFSDQCSVNFHRNLCAWMLFALCEIGCCCCRSFLRDICNGKGTVTPHMNGRPTPYPATIQSISERVSCTHTNTCPPYSPISAVPWHITMYYIGLFSERAPIFISCSRECLTADASARHKQYYL